MVSKDTIVLMTDGTKKKIKDIRIGDMIESSQGSISKVNDVWSGYEDRLIALEFSCGIHIYLSEDHPVLCGDSWIKAIEVEIGNHIRTYDDDECSIIGKKIVDNDSIVYNLDLNNQDEGFWAEKIAVGDIEVQNRICNSKACNPIEP